MNDRNRVLLLIGIMAMAIILVGGVSILLLFRAAFSEEQARLVETAQSQARLMEAISNFSAINNQDYPGGARESALSQFRAAHENYEGFGDTGEFTLAQREEDLIVFILRHRHSNLDQPEPVQFNSELAEPMRRALSGQSGTVVGLDYRGVHVLAAYEPVANLDMGIVAKIDMTEIRAPFIQAGIIAGIVMIVVIVLGAILFRQVSNPILRQLTINEERFRELFNNLTSGVAIYEAQQAGEDFIFRDMNKSGERISNTKREDIIGKNVSEVFPGVKKMGLLDVFQQVWQTGELAHLPASLYEDDRNTFWTNNKVFRLPSRELVSVYDDITDQVKTQATLELQSAIVANMSESVNLVQAKDGKLVYMNPNSEQVFGYSTGELIGKHVSILNASTDKKSAEVTANEIMAAIQDQGRWEGEILNIRKNGRKFWTLASVSLFNHPEHGPTLISVQSDISDRKQAELERENLLNELEIKNDEMESFIYTVSHDLKAPLISVNGFAAALQKEYNEELDGQGQHYLNRIQANIARMDEFITKLLELSRIGRVVGDFEHIDIRTMILDLQDEMEIELQNAKITLPASLPTTFGDRLRIHQVFANLIDNAIKYRSPERPLEIKIGYKKQGKLIQFSISDNGIGIDQRHFDRIFKPFHQLQSDKPGTGMGLSLIKKAIEHLGGQIWIESQSGKGTTFYFTLPHIRNGDE